MTYLIRQYRRTQLEVDMGAVAELISSYQFPCVMAKGLVKSSSLVEEIVDYRMADISERIVEIVRAYEETHPTEEQALYSLSIEFKNVPSHLRESFDLFEQAFWEIVGEFRSVEATEGTSNRPEDRNFRLNVGGSSYFLILLHPDSPRKARRSKRPAIVFNRHQQFEWLKKTGVFAGIRDKIRQLDFKLQGTANPMLGDFGESSEIYQYSGRDYTRLSRCPVSRVKGWLKWKS